MATGKSRRLPRLIPHCNIGKTESQPREFTANEVPSRRQFLSTLAFAMAIVTVFDSTVEARAAECVQSLTSKKLFCKVPPTSLSRKSDSVDPVAYTLLGASAWPGSTRANLWNSFQDAWGAGKAGFSAAIVSVLTLMWLKTATVYQYRYGGDLKSALKKLMAQGGISRLYQGMPIALVEGPLARFGDTAAQVGVLAFLNSFPETAALPIPIRTAAVSINVCVWRILCLPLDTSKVALQVEGPGALEQLKKKVMEQGPAPLFQGWLPSTLEVVVKDFPFFLTYNYLALYLPTASKDQVLLALLRAAFIGVAASCSGDIVSNSLRVIKTTQQTGALNRNGTLAARKALGDKGAEGGLSIREALALVLETDGIKGLLGRGLKSRLLGSAIQGALFNVLWKYFQTIGSAQ